MRTRIRALVAIAVIAFGIFVIAAPVFAQESEPDFPNAGPAVLQRAATAERSMTARGAEPAGSRVERGHLGVSSGVPGLSSPC